jgi:WD40 repeat protein
MINGISWDPAGTLLASCSEDNYAVLWTPRQDEYLGKFEGHVKSINALAWSNIKSTSTNISNVISPLLATASRDQTVKLWDVEKLNCTMTLEGHLN